MSLPPEGAELLYSESSIERTLDRLALQIDLDLAGSDVVCVCVLRGGVAFTWDIIRRLKLSVSLEFVQVQRYRGTVGHKPQIISSFSDNLTGRTVLLMDDILDYGNTLELLKNKLSASAREVRIAVLVQKKVSSSPKVSADYVGLLAPDKFLIGRGMDLDGKFRDLPAIYAIAEYKVD